MSKLVCFVLLITCITPSIFSPGQQTDSERPDTPQAREFFNHLQQMLRDNDRKGIAGLVEYPMLTTLNGKRYIFRIERSFSKTSIKSLIEAYAAPFSNQQTRMSGAIVTDLPQSTPTRLGQSGSMA
jgi:hypothetical protein